MTPRKISRSGQFGEETSGTNASEAAREGEAEKGGEGLINVVAKVFPDGRTQAGGRRR